MREHFKIKVHFSAHPCYRKMYEYLTEPSRGAARGRAGPRPVQDPRASIRAQRAYPRAATPPGVHVSPSLFDSLGGPPGFWGIWAGLL